MLKILFPTLDEDKVEQFSWDCAPTPPAIFNEPHLFLQDFALLKFFSLYNDIFPAISYYRLYFAAVFSKVCREIVNNRLSITWRNVVVFFLILSKVSGLLNELQIH